MATKVKRNHIHILGDSSSYHPDREVLYRAAGKPGNAARMMPTRLYGQTIKPRIKIHNQEMRLI